MKKPLAVSVLAIFVMAGVANAGELRMQWKNEPSKKITLAPSQTAVMEIILNTTRTNDTFVGMVTRFAVATNPPGGADQLQVVDFQEKGIFDLFTVSTTGNLNSTGPPGGPYSGALFAAGIGGQNTLQPGDTLMGNMVIHQEVGDPSKTKEVTFLVDTTAFAPNLTTETGSDWTLVAPGSGDENKRHRFTIGNGNPGNDLGSPYDIGPRSPLTINKTVPEPATLALLALGGLAALRRRR